MQEPSAVVVFDLEFTAWPGSMARNWTGPGEFREIVQIGAVRASPAEGFRETDAFCRLVRPRLNPVLSAYFTELTGITQTAIEADGSSFEGAVDAFAAFVGSAAQVLSNGNDGLVVLENCHLNGVPCPIPADRFRNVGPILAAASGLGGSHITSSALPSVFAGVPALRAHDALADARMVAAALGMVQANGFPLDL